MGRGTLEEVQDGSGDPLGGLKEPRGGPGRVGGTSRRFGMGQGTHWEVWGNLVEVRDGSGEPRKGL